MPTRSPSVDRPSVIRAPPALTNRRMAAVSPSLNARADAPGTTTTSDGDSAEPTRSARATCRGVTPYARNVRRKLSWSFESGPVADRSQTRAATRAAGGDGGSGLWLCRRAHDRATKLFTRARRPGRAGGRSATPPAPGDGPVGETTAAAA